MAWDEQIRTCIGYLSYVNSANYAYRHEDFNSSIRSLEELLDDTEVSLVSVDNSSEADVRTTLAQTHKFDKLFHYKKNYFDLALFYSALWHAKDRDLEYVAFLYDDSILIDDVNAFHAVEQFMDAYPEVACTRLSAWSFDNMSAYDSNVTPKSKNPDAVRHRNEVTGEALVWDGPFEHGGKRFYKCKWHYTSRPTMWRVSELEKLMPSSGEIGMLQAHEGEMMRRCQEAGIVFGALDGGLVRTTDVKRSARTNELNLETEMKIRVNLDELREAYEKFR